MVAEGISKSCESAFSTLFHQTPHSKIEKTYLLMIMIMKEVKDIDDDAGPAGHRKPVRPGLCSAKQPTTIHTYIHNALTLTNYVYVSQNIPRLEIITLALCSWRMGTQGRAHVAFGWARQVVVEHKKWGWLLELPETFSRPETL